MFFAHLVFLNIFYLNSRRGCQKGCGGNTQAGSQHIGGWEDG